MAAQGDDEFTVHKYEHEIYMVREKFYTSWNLPNIWVVKGSSKDLIIDTGVGLWDLPGFLKKHNIIGEKPYEGVATHIHFDHTGGAHQFEYFSIHKAEAEALKRGDQYEICSHMTAREVAKPPSPDWHARNYKVPAKEPTRILEDGDIFDLGNRKIKIMHLPGHTRGSIAFYEEETKSLFSGDIIYIGPLFDCLPYSNVSDYLKTAQTLKDLSSQVDKVYPGHAEVFDGQTLNSLLDDYISSKQACCDGCKTSLTGVAVDILLKGRNTDSVPSKCCYHCCCCYHCLGAVVSQPLGSEQAQAKQTENTGLLSGDK